tara:strand:- start:392 stop:586 length:195 start_codon:yes stop_codon:yes gene_type:complete
MMQIFALIVIAIAAVTILAIVALMEGINGIMLGGAFSAIGGLTVGGYVKMMSIYRKQRGCNNGN